MRAPCSPAGRAGNSNFSEDADEAESGVRRSVRTVTADVWDLYGQLADRDPSSLTEAQRRFVAVCDLRQEVDAGGFDNYFRAWGGTSAPDAIAGLPALLGSEWAALLRSAVVLFGPRYPHDPDERADKIDKSDLFDRLRQLDERFHALEASTDADGRLNAYLAANPEVATTT
jgi:hypothetical protein